jgi:D-tagatose-1,6-bisphosphate aldolase subunit GatZ/KbaZ
MSSDPFEELAMARARGEARGLYSVCSSHPLVLEAAVRRVASNGLPVLVEATANQVNQDGGYTGMKPADFAARLGALRDAYGAPEGRIVFGGDHLGPYPWRSLRAEEAMAKAEELVRSFVAAGARKIHLDASMVLGGDPAPAPGMEVAAARAVRLCAAAEDARRSLPAEAPPPVYVIGTEVPVPGGSRGSGEGEDSGPAPTRAEDFLGMAALHERLFADAGLSGAWKRVVAVVVQPGVEFDSNGLSPYRRDRAASLTAALAARPSLGFECHSTDYQSDDSLRELVEDGFRFLKVGPALSFALREALVGLGEIEAELDGARGRNRALSAILEAMRGDDSDWKGYYDPGDSLELAYSLSDRARYYWGRPEVAAEIDRLFAALEGRSAPPGLVSQYLPRLDGPQCAIRAAASLRPREIVMDAVDAELARYEAACFPGRSEGGNHVAR